MCGGRSWESFRLILIILGIVRVSHQETLLQQMQGLALFGLAVVQGLGLLQLVGCMLSLFLQLVQGLEPAVLLFQLLELALLVF